MFNDLIEMLLAKRVEAVAVVEKIDKLLDECGYVKQCDCSEGEVVLDGENLGI